MSTVTLQHLRGKYGRQWVINDGAGGGWYAVRRLNVSTHAVARGLSNVRCGASLDELAKNLASETRLEEQLHTRATARTA